MRVLVVNAGSSSLKLSLLGDGDEALGGRELEARRWEFDADEAGAALAALGDADAVGHRVVHGGATLVRPARVDARLRDELAALVELAPLHQRAALAGMDLVGRVRPDLPAVACFDTAFHAGMPAAASTYALPREWRERYALRRYGFHGLSHAHAARRAAELLGEPPFGLRVVTCHLGSGASLAAVENGASVATTMGFTPLEGLVMGTRSGDVDPGLVLWLMRTAGMSADEVQDGLEHRSGLLGLAGVADMREVLSRAAAGDAGAGLALDVYVHRLRGSIAAMTAAMGGLEALVFTGGVGEHAPEVRERAAAGLDFLGVAIDAARNRAGDGDRDVGAVTAPVRTLVVAAREDLEIASQVRAVLGS
jgi:acetate kinase